MHTIVVVQTDSTGIPYGLQLTWESIKSSIIADNTLQNLRLSISIIAVIAIDIVTLSYRDYVVQKVGKGHRAKTVVEKQVLEGPRFLKHFALESSSNAK